MSIFEEIVLLAKSLGWGPMELCEYVLQEFGTGSTCELSEEQKVLLKKKLVHVRRKAVRVVF